MKQATDKFTRDVFQLTDAFLVSHPNRPQFRIEYFVAPDGLGCFPAVTFVACPTVEDAFSIVSGEVDFRSIPVVRSKGMFCFFNGVEFSSGF